MTFTDFKSIAQVQETFDIKYSEADYIQYTADIEPSSAFLEEFTFSREHIDVFASETSRCENVIYPILRDVYKRYVDCFSLWSHKSIAYDAQLSGTPDYLISKNRHWEKPCLGLRSLSSWKPNGTILSKDGGSVWRNWSQSRRSTMTT